MVLFQRSKLVLRAHSLVALFYLYLPSKKDEGKTLLREKSICKEYKKFVVKEWRIVPTSQRYTYKYIYIFHKNFFFFSWNYMYQKED